MVDVESSKQWLFASDVDDTLTGDERSLRELNDRLARERDRVCLVLNSSRPCRSLRASLAEDPFLPAPDFLIGALGTEIEDGAGRSLDDHASAFAAHWNRSAVVKLLPQEGLKPHAAEYQTEYKISYDIVGQGVTEALRSRLKRHGVAARVLVTHGSKMDIIPIGAGKGAAIAYLRRRLHIDVDRVVVAGDSANDVDMFVGDNHGIVVANADPELMELVGPKVYRAAAPHAAGVLEGLRYWNVF